MPGAGQRPAILVMAFASAGPEALDAALGAERAAAVRACLHGRTMAWAQTFAPGAVRVAADDETTPELGLSELTLPAEAFVRLIYGRLDADHTPPVKNAGVELDELRPIFPGF